MRRIEQETGVRRETAGAGQSGSGRRSPANPANENEVTTRSDANKTAPHVSRPAPKTFSTR